MRNEQATLNPSTQTDSSEPELEDILGITDETATQQIPVLELPNRPVAEGQVFDD